MPTAVIRLTRDIVRSKAVRRPFRYQDPFNRCPDSGF
jgi:hypothetical protein